MTNSLKVDAKWRSRRDGAAGSFHTKRGHIVSRSPQDTMRFGTLLGKCLTEGLVIALSGELGSGKTCLAQGIARGLRVPEHLYVTSPSYVIVNEYPGSLRLLHIDLYRIQNTAELDDIGFDEMLNSDDVKVVEWADKADGVLPEERLFISISIVDDQTRELHIRASGQSAVDLIETCLLEFGP
jgi:tRNA threonylcarbamoyladenosine biosynthesis protein TsaE